MTIEEILQNCDCFDEFVEKSGLDSGEALEIWNEFWSKYIYGNK